MEGAGKKCFRGKFYFDAIKKMNVQFLLFLMFSLKNKATTKRN